MLASSCNSQSMQMLCSCSLIPSPPFGWTWSVAAQTLSGPESRSTNMWMPWSTWVVILWTNWTLQPVIQPTTMIGGCNTHSPRKIQSFTQAHALFLGEKALLGRFRTSAVRSYRSYSCRLKQPVKDKPQQEKCNRKLQLNERPFVQSTIYEGL